jgi:hypothetical protein
LAIAEDYGFTSQDVREIRAAEAVAPSSEPSIPADLKDYWRCFHCDFHTTNRRDAEAHFGDRDDAEEFKPICKWWSNMDDAERREQFQGVIRQMNDVTEDNNGLIERIGRAEDRIEELLDQIDSTDATLCECRYYPSPKGCNCDIHAAHQILRAALATPSGVNTKEKV